MSIRTLTSTTFLKNGRGIFSVVSRNKATSAAAQIHAPDEQTNVKAFSEIPGPKGLPIVGTMFETLKKSSKLYEMVRQRHEEYGPIYREKLGNFSFVFVSDAEAIEQLVRQGDKYPARLLPEQWLQYKIDRGHNLGLLNSDGEHWHSLRRVVDKHMMKIKTVESYTGTFNQVVADFLERLANIRSTGKEIPSLDNELFNWSLESVGSILYETRLGCLSDNRSQEIGEFIQSTHNVFAASRRLLFVPENLAKYLIPKTVRQHNQAWDTLYRIGHKTIDTRIKEIEAKSSKGENVGFVTHFLKEDAMSIKDVYANILELMMAAIDTTSNTTQMALYEISRNPQVQDAILEEVNRVVPPGQQPEAEHLREMHYIKAVVKETLRLYPISVGLTRMLQQDIVLLGYHIPKGNGILVDLMSLTRSARYYEDPDTFRPERWLRDKDTPRPNPFTWLPFGFGQRMCVGRRVAEFEAQLLLTQMVRKFRLEPVSMEPVEMITNLILLPKDPIRIRAHERD